MAGRRWPPGRLHALPDPFPARPLPTFSGISPFSAGLYLRVLPRGRSPEVLPGPRYRSGAAGRPSGRLEGEGRVGGRAASAGRGPGGLPCAEAAAGDTFLHVTSRKRSRCRPRGPGEGHRGREGCPGAAPQPAGKRKRNRRWRREVSRRRPEGLRGGRRSALRRTLQGSVRRSAAGTRGRCKLCEAPLAPLRPGRWAWCGLPGGTGLPAPQREAGTGSSREARGWSRRLGCWRDVFWVHKRREPQEKGGGAEVGLGWQLGCPVEKPNEGVFQLCTFPSQEWVHK